MLVPGFGPHRVVAELLPVQVELAADEPGNQTARAPTTGPASGRSWRRVTQSLSGLRRR